MTLCFIALATYLSLVVSSILREAKILLDEIDKGEGSHWEWYTLVIFCPTLGPVFEVWYIGEYIWKWSKR